MINKHRSLFFVGNTGSGRYDLLNGCPRVSQQSDWICLSGTPAESTPAENTLCCLFVHLPVYCVGQPAHCHHHLPQSHTFCSHVLLSHLRGLIRCFLHLCEHTQNDDWSVAPEENQLLGWLPNSALFGALHRRIRDHCPHCHGLWPLCGHLQAFALHGHHATIMRQEFCQLLVVVAWIGGILHGIVQALFSMDLTFCGPNAIDHFVWFLLIVETCLQWQLYAGYSGGSQQWGHVFASFRHPSHLLHSYPEPLEIPWLWRMAKSPLCMCPTLE